MLVLYHEKENKGTETKFEGEDYKFNLEPTEFKCWLDTQIGLASEPSNLVVRNLGERYQLEVQT